MTLVSSSETIQHKRSVGEDSRAASSGQSSPLLQSPFRTSSATTCRSPGEFLSDRRGAVYIFWSHSLLWLYVSRAAWFVCLLGTLVSCSKVAEPVQILFTGKTRIGPRKLVFDGVQIFRLERGSLIWDMCWLIGKGSPRLICNAAIKIEVVFMVVFVQNAVHTRMMITFS